MKHLKQLKNLKEKMEKSKRFVKPVTPKEQRTFFLLVDLRNVKKLNPSVKGNRGT